MDQLKHHLEQYHDNLPRSYGTSGFRAKWDTLKSVMARCGALIALRSCVTKKCTGIMITASHNPAEDNGVKLVEPDGHMLASSWEQYAAQLVNSNNPIQVLSDIAATYKIPFPGDVESTHSQDADSALAYSGIVVVGYDTRESSPELAQLAIKSIELMHGRVICVGWVTTPQLHFLVDHANREKIYSQEFLSPTLYYDQLAAAFASLLDLSNGNRVLSPLVLDCANGIGAKSMQDLLSVPVFADKLKDSVILVNTDIKSTSLLNHQCGADYVQKSRQLPRGFNIDSYQTLYSADAVMRLASFDGDADRLVHYFPSADTGQLVLIDGDKFAALVCMYLIQCLRQAAINPTVGVVQTAYSNGASKEFLESMPGVVVAVSYTGVKHLEKQATQFDVGIYWEPNGHGTVLFSEQLMEFISELLSQSDRLNKDQVTALNKVLLLSRLVNQTVGDAISDLLLAEYILLDLKYGLWEWSNIYKELPSFNKVVRVKDKSIVEAEDFDRQVKLPRALREAVESAVTRYSKGRSFVRPSGTEDVVRIYAEAETLDQATALGMEVAKAVYDLCQGVGDRP